MNTSKFFAVAALSAVAAFASVAQAGEVDSSQYGVKFEGSRTRAEVKAEAAVAARTYRTEADASRVIGAPAQAGADRASVRAQTAQAERLGQLRSGEATPAL